MKHNPDWRKCKLCGTIHHKDNRHTKEACQFMLFVDEVVHGRKSKHLSREYRLKFIKETMERV